MRTTTASARCLIAPCSACPYTHHVGDPGDTDTNDTAFNDNIGDEPACRMESRSNRLYSISGRPICATTIPVHRSVSNPFRRSHLPEAPRPSLTEVDSKAPQLVPFARMLGSFTVSQPQETLDLDLQLTPTAHADYLARVLTSPAGQAVATFARPFSETEETTFTRLLLSTPRSVSLAERQRLLKEYGQRLFHALFHDDTLVCLERSLDEVRRRNGTLRIKLRLSDTPELVTLPWEFLYHPQRNRFLTQSTSTSLTHFLSLPDPVQSLTVTLPLRMLVIIAEAQDLPPLDVEQEWTNLQTALAPLIEKGQVIVDRLPHATLGALQQTLRRHEYHVLHFVGHGDFDEQQQQGNLAFTDDDGYAAPVRGEVLAQLLHNERTLRLVLLNACEGARASATAPFSGVAQQLVQQGVPAVIAMRHPISDAAAITFSHEFYGALADGYSVDAAVTEGRVALSTQLDNGEWGVPQLIMRAGDGLLWHLTEQTTPGSVNGTTIREDLGILTELMQQSNVRDLVAMYRADFDAASRQIDILSNYKDLHDLLHKLQFRCYNVIAQEARRFPDDELALDNLLNYEVTLQDIVSNLEGVIEEAQFSQNETAWINDLLDAQQRLREALETMEQDALRRVIWLMRRVLALQPSNVNHRLNAAARALRLDTIIHSLDAIRQTLRQFNVTSAEIEQLENGVDELQLLDTRLSQLVNEHDQWQEVQRILGRIEDMMAYDQSELEFSWPDLNARITTLCADYHGEWVARFQQDATQLEKALQAQNPVRVRSYFQRYRQRAGNRFFQVDTQLKELCTELRKVGDLLSSILRLLA